MKSYTGMKAKVLSRIMPIKPRSGSSGAGIISIENCNSCSPRSTSTVAVSPGFNFSFRKSTGETIRISLIFVITKFLECLKNKNSPIIFGDGKQVRDFIYIEDVVIANIQAMFSETKYGFFNIGTGVPTTILELAKLMIKLSNIKIEPIFEKPTIGDIRLSQADISNVQKILGWHAETALEEGLKKLMNSMD